MKSLECVTPRTVCLFFCLRIASTYAFGGDLPGLKVNSLPKGVTPTPATHRRLVEFYDTGVSQEPPISSALVHRHLTQFLELLKEAGLYESIDSMDIATLVVPTNEALANYETLLTLRELRADKDKLREILLFHTSRTKLDKCNIRCDTKLESGLVDKSIRINKFSKERYPWEPRVFTAATAECARILNFDDYICDGTVYEIDRLIMPPTGSVYDVIQSNKEYSILREVLQGTGLERTLKSRSPITLLAPVNEAFYNLEDEELERIKTDKNLANLILRKHIFPEILCCSGVGNDSERYNQKNMENLGGSVVGFVRRHNGVYAGLGALIYCDIMATNGIIHSVNNIIVKSPYTDTWDPSF